MAHRITFTQRLVLKMTDEKERAAVEYIKRMRASCYDEMDHRFVDLAEMIQGIRKNMSSLTEVVADCVSNQTKMAENSGKQMVLNEILDKRIEELEKRIRF